MRVSWIKYVHDDSHILKFVIIRDPSGGCYTPTVLCTALKSINNALKGWKASTVYWLSWNTAPEVLWTLSVCNMMHFWQFPAEFIDFSTVCSMSQETSTFHSRSKINYFDRFWYAEFWENLFMKLPTTLSKCCHTALWNPEMCMLLLGHGEYDSELTERDLCSGIGQVSVCVCVCVCACG